MSANREINNLSTSLILARDASFEGCLSFEGIARICGSFNGEINSPGLLIIEPGAKVSANIEVLELIVKGVLRGEVKASRQITLLSGCECYGTLMAPHLHIEKGALFEGKSLKRPPA